MLPAKIRRLDTRGYSFGTKPAKWLCLHGSGPKKASSAVRSTAAGRPRPALACRTLTIASTLVANRAGVKEHGRSSGGVHMAEGLLGGILGGEEDKKSAAARAGTEAFAASVATNIANQSPAVAAKTAAFLEEQAELVKAQRKSVETEHEYFKAEWGQRLLGTRLRTAFQIFIALFATVIGIGVAIMIPDAATSRRVVIEPFHAPPGLAAQGIDGTVVASGLLDELG